LSWLDVFRAIADQKDAVAVETVQAFRRQVMRMDGSGRRERQEKYSSFLIPTYMCYFSFSLAPFYAFVQFVSEDELLHSYPLQLFHMLHTLGLSRP